MPASSPALIALLRRHLRVVAVLFVCLVMLKTGLAMACAADSLAGPVDTTALVVAGDNGVDAVAVTAASADDCWHSAAGGCHCSCAHVAPLLFGSPGVNLPAAAPVLFAATPHAVCLAPRDDALRPPIA